MSTAPLAYLIDAIGTGDFGVSLIRVLHELCGADHCAMYEIDGKGIQALGSASYDPMSRYTPMAQRYVQEGFWQRDPALSLARRQLATSSTTVVKVDLDHEQYSALREPLYAEWGDRIVLCGRRNHAELGISVLRRQQQPGFEPEAADRLAGACDILLSGMAKHLRLMDGRPGLATLLTDVDAIEHQLTRCTNLPCREVQVCARIVYGMCTAGIAVDLAIGEESVKTYRRRAYQRLGIGTERELVVWYLEHWGARSPCVH